MTRDHADALAALFDGERVDRAAVERALADPEAPAALAALAGLRALAQADLGHPDEAFYTAMAPVLKPRRGLRWWWWFSKPALAASLVWLAGMTGYYLRPALAPRSQPTTHAAQSGPPAAPSAPQTPARTEQAAVRPSTLSPAPRGTDAGGPPSPSLRLRFSQWQAQGNNAGGPPE